MTAIFAYRRLCGCALVVEPGRATLIQTSSGNIIIETKHLRIQMKTVLSVAFKTVFCVHAH